MAIPIIAWVLLLGIPVILLITRRQSPPNGPPSISLLYWFYLLASDPVNIWVRVYERYGSVGVLEVPILGKTYVVMGPENSRLYHVSKNMDLTKGTTVALGDFAPEGAGSVVVRPRKKEARKFIGEAATRPLSSPTFIKEVETSILAMLAKPPWSDGFVPDLFSETWDLSLNMGFQHFVGIDTSFTQLQQLKDMFYLVDPEFVMKSPRMFYDKKGLMADTHRNYQKWADLFKGAVDDLKAKVGITGDQRRKTSGEENNFGADLLLSVAEDSTDENGIVDTYEIMSNFWGLILAAQVNTQASMGWLLLRIAEDPKLCARVMEEQEKILGGRGVPLAEVTPTMQDLAEMEFIDRMLVENLRLMNQSFTSFRTTLEDMPVGGYTVPGGSFCIFPHATLNLNKGLHADPLTFDPDRTVEFMGGNAPDTKEPKRVKLGHGGPHANYNVAVWGVGKHPCVGTRFAIAVVKMFISTVVRRYELSHVQGTWPKVPRISLGTSKSYNKVQIRLKTRV